MRSALALAAALALSACSADSLVGAELSGPDAAAVAAAPRADRALWFGPDGSSLPAALTPVAGQTVRVAATVRVDGAGAQVLLASDAGLRLAVEPDGALALALPGWTAGEPALWTLASGAGAVARGRWTRVEAVYDELRLTLRVDGRAVAETLDHADEAPRPPGATVLAPAFTGAVADLAFTDAEGRTVVQHARFDEGAGTATRVAGLHGGTWAVGSPRWVAGPGALPAATDR